MKKILFLLCVLAVTNVTFAQERAKKTEVIIVKEGVKFKLDSKTKAITEVVIAKFKCTQGLGCKELMTLSLKKPLIFTANDVKPERFKEEENFSKGEISGIITVGKNKYKADLLFFTRVSKDKKVTFNGSIVIEGSSFKSTKGRAVTIDVKAIQ